MVGTWERSRRGAGNVLRGCYDVTNNMNVNNSVGSGGVGILLDLLGRGSSEDQNPCLETSVSLPTSSGGRLCPVCGRYISNPSNLRKHMHRAHGTRNFFCPACHKSYRVACDLRRHALAAHNIRMESGNTSALLPSQLQSCDEQQSLTRSSSILGLEGGHGSGEEDANHLSPEGIFPRTPSPEVGPQTYNSISNTSLIQPEFHSTSQNEFPSSMQDNGTRPTALV